MRLLISTLATLFLLSGCGYNRLQGLDEDVKASWSEVQNQYQRRADLIPNLVNTVKGYTKHEEETLVKVTEARAQATQTTIDASKLGDEAAFKKFEQAQGELSGALSRLLVVAEKYPNLKANENFMSLQGELGNTEDKIAYARQFYNASVQTYNTSIQSIPTNIIAGIGGFRAKEFFQAVGDERGPVQVRF